MIYTQHVTPLHTRHLVCYYSDYFSEDLTCVYNSKQLRPAKIFYWFLCQWRSNYYHINVFIWFIAKFSYTTNNDNELYQYHSTISSQFNSMTHDCSESYNSIWLHLMQLQGSEPVTRCILSPKLHTYSHAIDILHEVWSYNSISNSPCH